MKNLIKNTVNYLEGKTMKQFNEEKFNVKKLQPKATDIELNKCTHECFDKYTGECALCGYKLHFDIHDPKELYKSVNYLIEKLEAFKTIMYSCGSDKEISAAKKYFDIIPLLKNIDSLHNICLSQFISSSVYVVEDEPDIDSIDQNKDDSDQYFLKSLTLEDESKKESD